MYDRKRQIRESTNQLLIYEPVRKILQYVPPKGITPQERKDHTAAVYQKSMLVYGGVLQTGAFTGEMLNLDLDFFTWSRIQYKQNYEPLA